MDGVIGIAAAAAILFSYAVAPHGTGEPRLSGGDARVEKLYVDGGRIVATPIMNADAAWAACPSDYEVRRERREVRGEQTFLVWDLRCR